MKDDDSAARESARLAKIRALVMEQGRLSRELQNVELELRRLRGSGLERHHAEMDMLQLDDEEREAFLRRAIGDTKPKT